ncbi:hypothetical protein [Paraburkholderia tropica]|uniref:hypothetical protein n=1 Tax=Paraburkholderia tropica TaxID=92647 RepID=UPI003D28E604
MMQIASHLSQADVARSVPMLLAWREVPYAAALFRRFDPRENALGEWRVAPRSGARLPQHGDRRDADLRAAHFLCGRFLSLRTFNALIRA